MWMCSKHGGVTLAFIVVCSCLKRCWTMGIPWQRSQTYSRSSSNHRVLLDMSLALSLEIHSMLEGFFEVCVCHYSLSFSLSLSLFFLSPLPPSLSHHSVSSTLPTGQLSNVPWRRTGVKYTNNEVYFTIILTSVKKINSCCIMTTTDLSGFDRGSRCYHWQISELCHSMRTFCFRMFTWFINHYS